MYLEIQHTVEKKPKTQTTRHFLYQYFFSLKFGEFLKDTRKIFRNILTNIFVLINYHLLEETHTEMSAYN